MKMTPSGAGKQVGGALYVHRSALAHITCEHVALVDAAAAYVKHHGWNVAKIDLSGKCTVSLLDYEEFSAIAFPALRESHTVDIHTGEVTVRRYETNPPILHRKELLLAPNDSERGRYAALTKELERRGLFVDVSRRGRKDAWEALLTEAGVTIRDHRVFDNEKREGFEIVQSSADARPRNATAVERHRTAIGRHTLSAPMAALNAAGLLYAGVTVLDYGCGRGDDVRALRASGIDAVGWDPHFAPDPEALSPRAIVNLGFVLNVVEDPVERREVLRRAYELAERCLAVAVMQVGKGDVSGQRPHGDGFLTSRGTFQRYFTQTELRSFLLATLGVTPVSAGPGIFFVFREEELEQCVLSRRQMRMGVSSRVILPGPRPPASDVPAAAARREALNTVRNDLIDLFLALGRAPHLDDIPPNLRMRLSDARLSIRAALTDALTAIPTDVMNDSVNRRTDEVGRFFALSAFSGRAAYRRLAPSLHRDVRAFFGSLNAAKATAQRMLLDAGNAEGLAEDARAHAAAGLGVLVDDKYQVHARDFPKLTCRIKTYISIAQVVAGTLDNTTIYRVHLSSPKLTALIYPNFETSVLPKLSNRTKVDLQNGDVRIFDYTGEGRASVLTEKSRYMTGNENTYRDQLTFDQSLKNVFGDKLSKVTYETLIQGMRNVGIAPPYSA